jgi:serine/threonine-protein kinase HipA
MPAGSGDAGDFAKEIEERATEVRTHAGQEGVPEVSGEVDEAPSLGSSTYGQ